MASDRRVWFITGAGRGIGRALTDAALEAGERVVATVRDAAVFDEVVAARPDQLHVEVVDVRDRAGVRGAVDRGVERFGRLDVVVNNAGYGLVGAIEEVSEHDASAIIDTNLTGPIWCTQAALPHLRRQGSGHIVQISTVGAVGSMPTFGLYNASKWALEGFSEALAAEVSRFGLRVSIAELGGFATDWSGRSLQFASPNAAYDALREELFGTATIPWPAAADDADQTDEPATIAAAAIRSVVDAPTGPLRVLIGADAPAMVGAALDARRVDYERDPRFEWPAAASTTAPHPEDDPWNRSSPSY